MKRSGLIILTLLICFSSIAQIKIGFSSTLGSSNVLTFKQWGYENGMLKFTPKFTSSIGLSSIKYYSDQFAIQGELGFSLLSTYCNIYGFPPEGIERIGRISIPVRFYFLKEKVIGGFVGIENSYNISLTKLALKFIMVPYSISTSVGLSYEIIENMIMGLSYSMDFKPFAQYKEGFGFFGSGDRPHYHFYQIGLSISYYPWEI